MNVYLWQIVCNKQTFHYSTELGAMYCMDKWRLLNPVLSLIEITKEIYLDWEENLHIFL